MRFIRFPAAPPEFSVTLPSSSKGFFVRGIDRLISRDVGILLILPYVVFPTFKKIEKIILSLDVTTGIANLIVHCFIRKTYYIKKTRYKRKGKFYLYPLLKAKIFEFIILFINHLRIPQILSTRRLNESFHHLSKSIVSLR